MGGEAGDIVTGSTAPDDVVYLYQDSSGTDNWQRLSETSTDGKGAFVLNWDQTTWKEGIPDFRGYKIFDNGVEVSSSNHAIGWARLDGFGTGIRHFWQQFPKAIEVRNNRIIARL